MGDRGVETCGNPSKAGGLRMEGIGGCKTPVPTMEAPSVGCCVKEGSVSGVATGKDGTGEKAKVTACEGRREGNVAGWERADSGSKVGTEVV